MRPRGRLEAGTRSKKVGLKSSCKNRYTLKVLYKSDLRRMSSSFKMNEQPQSITYTASICEDLLSSGSCFGNYYPICMKLSGYIYFYMKISVQPFLTSPRPLIGLLASLQPPNGLGGQKRFNKHSSFFHLMMIYVEKSYILHIQWPQLEVV